MLVQVCAAVCMPPENTCWYQCEIVKKPIMYTLVFILSQISRNVPTTCHVEHANLPHTECDILITCLCICNNMQTYLNHNFLFVFVHVISLTMVWGNGPCITVPISWRPLAWQTVHYISSPESWWTLVWQTWSAALCRRHPPPALCQSCPSGYWLQCTDHTGWPHLWNEIHIKSQNMTF